MNVESPRNGKKLPQISQKQKLLLFCIWFAILFVVSAVIILYGTNRDQIWYYPYDPTPTTLTPGQWIIVGTIVAMLFSVIFFRHLSIHLIHQKPIQKRMRILTGLWATNLIITGCVVSVFASVYWPTYFYNAGPYLMWDSEQNPTDAITVNWYTGLYTSSIVTYGESPEYLNFTASDSTLTQYHHISLSNLKPNTIYYYRLEKFPFSPSTLKQFKTAPTSAANFRFVVWSDPRENSGYESALKSPNMPSEIWNDLQEQGIDIDFSICTGDTTSRGVDFATWRLYLEDITTNDFASNHSHQVAIGNHERHDDPHVRNLPKFYPYDQQADRRFFYSFSYGQAHFIMLDTWDSGASFWSNFSTVQMDWLRADLEAHKDALFTTIYMHPPPLLSGENMSTTFKSLVQEYDIVSIMNGDWHSYFIQNVSKTLFITMGIGGNIENTAENPGYAGYMQVDVTPTTMNLTMVFTHNNTREPVLFLQK